MVLVRQGQDFGHRRHDSQHGSLRPRLLLVLGRLHQLRLVLALHGCLQVHA